MTILEEFLKTEAEQLGAKTPEYERNRREWLQALDHLFRQMEQWVRQADADKLLRVDRRSIELRDYIGSYPASALVIDLCGRKVEAVPVAWNVASSMAAAQLLGGPAEGLVDLTDGGHKYLLYRRGDRWVIIDDDAVRRVEPLDQQRFEAALVDLLR